MYFPDSNLLINAFHADTFHHAEAKLWLENCLNTGQPIQLFPAVETGYLRVVAHPEIFNPPTQLARHPCFCGLYARLPQWKFATAMSPHGHSGRLFAKR